MSTQLHHKKSASALHFRSLRLESLEERRLLASFQGLGDLPGGSFRSAALGVSADGKVVVGSGSAADGNYAVRWDNGVLSNLGTGSNSNAEDVSADGSVVVGSRGLGSGVRQPFRWEGGVTTSLEIQARGYAVSADGATVAGYVQKDGEYIDSAFRSDSGQITLLAGTMLNPQKWARGNDVSADGVTVVGSDGFSETEEQGFYYTAALWDDRGVRLLGTGDASEATAVNADGSVIVGTRPVYNSAGEWTGFNAFRWENGTISSIGIGRPTDVSADGSIVVGFGDFDDDFNDDPFIWDSEHGWRQLETVLTSEYGFDLPGWDLGRPNAISADGTVIVGTGTNPQGNQEAWRVDLAVRSFTNTIDLGKLALDFDSSFSESLMFYASADGIFDANDAVLLPSPVDLTPFVSSSLLLDVTNIPGGKRLRINPAAEAGAALKAALEDPDIDTIFAVGNPGSNSPSLVPFRGFYQADSGKRAVVRPGPDTRDTVTLSPSTITMLAVGANNALMKSSRATFSDASDVLIVTGDLDDEIVATSPWDENLIVRTGAGDDEIDSGGGDDELDGGSGSDTYWFREAAGGSDRIRESGDDENRLDFSSFDAPVNVSVHESAVSIEQVVTANRLKLTFENPSLIEHITGSNRNDVIRGNNRINHLEGRGGSDILVGEGDDGPKLGQGDFLEGGDNGDVLVGDGFELDATAWAALAATFSTFLESGNLAFSIELTHTGSGGDVLEGGDGDALIIGGDGSDAINAGVGRALIFGDAFNFTIGSDETFAIGLSGVIDDLSLSSFLFSAGGGLSFEGVGIDLIHGGSRGNAIVGGGGDDWIWGHDDSPADFLFGNEGEDHIFGGNGFNFIVGGAGDDPELVGGGGFDIIIGDSLKMPDGTSFTAPAANLFSGTASILQKLANLFSVEEETVNGNIIYKDKAFGFLIQDPGNDTIRGGDGVNLLFGGPGHDKITGGQDEDVIYGGDGSDSSLNGMDGVDLIVGGPGDDTLRGGTDDAANFLFGDILTVDLGFDLAPLLNGDFKSLVFPRITFDLHGAGIDQIYGANGFDFIVGGNGVDYIWGQNGDETGCSDPHATCKNNNIVFGDDFSTIAKLFSLAADFFGILTNPTSSISTIVNLAKSLYSFFVGSEGTSVDNGDTYEGGNGYDIVLGGDGVDTLNGAGGSDFLIGGYGDDVLDVGDGEQVEPLTILFGTVKIDEIGWGGHGNDVFYGGTGSDALMSDEGTDTFYGGDGDDVLAGGSDGDMLFGESGNDWLYGEDGDDVLNGGPGADKLHGGSGDDTFFFDPEDQIDDPVDRLPGDTNSDRRVDLVDLNNVRNNFGAMGAGVLGDANDDGRVDLQDLNAVRNNFGASASGASTSRRRAESAGADDRDRFAFEQRQKALSSRRVGSRIDDLVFGIDDGINVRPFSVVNNQLPKPIRRKAIRFA